ncbi:MAG: histidine kinase [Bacteroidota bacterium]
MSLPDRLLHFHKRHRWLSHVVFWLIFLFIGVSSSKYRNGNRATYGFEFISDALYMSAEMIFAYALAYFVVPQFLYRKRYLLAATGFVVSSYAACVVGRIFIVKICEPLAGIAPKASETYAEILRDLPKLLYNYYLDMMAAASIFVFLKLLKDQHEAQKHALQLEKEKTETELRLLKTQLNPHFLFNTLNNIYSLSFISQPATSKSIAGLAEILDHILYRCNEQYVPLSAEINLVRNYIELEKLRYDERLTVNFNIDIEHDIEVAPLILLSLVENAFKHGASDDAGAPMVDIDLRVTAENFIFNITNSIATYNSTEKWDAGDRIGLNNLRRQLDLIYGKAYRLDVNREDKLFKVTLCLHLNEDINKHEKNTVLAG